MTLPAAADTAKESGHSIAFNLGAIALILAVAGLGLAYAIDAAGRAGREDLTGTVDRTLGGLFGLVRGTVAVLALAVVVHLTGLKEATWWTESMTAGVATAALRGLKPVVPDAVGVYFPA